jgi:MFS family permease
MQYLGGHLADRYPLKWVYVLSFLVQGPLLFALAGFAGLPLVAAAALAVLLSIGVLPAENMMLARFTPERHRSLAFAVKYVIAFGSAPLALLIVARINEATGGFYWLFVLLAGLAALVFAAALLLPGDPRPAPGPRVVQPAE